MPRQQEDTSTTTCTQLDCLCTVSRVYRVLSHLLQTFPVSRVIKSSHWWIPPGFQVRSQLHPMWSCQWCLLDGGCLPSHYGWLTQQVYRNCSCCTYANLCEAIALPPCFSILSVYLALTPSSLGRSIQLHSLPQLRSNVPHPWVINR